MAYTLTLLALSTTAAATSSQNALSNRQAALEQEWRRSHPLHHLADEEADITKWAFPDSADLVQVGEKAQPIPPSPPGATYKRGEDSVFQCPLEYSKIGTEEECKKAVSEIGGLVYSHKDSWPGNPTGCFKNPGQDKRAYFNTHPSGGQPNNGHSLICKRDAATTTTTTAQPVPPSPPGATYKRGEDSVFQCPLEYSKIGTEEECKKAVSEIGGLVYSHKDSWPGNPTGCFKNAGQDVAYFNTQPNGGQYAGTSLICKRDAATTTTTTTTTTTKAGMAAFEKCDAQERFDIMMCKSYMCTKCTLAYCMETCQKTQKDFPTCRCADWPKARASFSGGDFAGKGKAGDVGDYAKAASAFLSVEIKEDN